MATFCLLHGKWHDASSWEPLARRLEQHGHRCVAPNLPFDDPAAGHEERAWPAIAALRGAQNPVVVGHSLAAGVAALVAAQCGVSLLVYLCPAPVGPFIGVEVGTAPFREGFPFPPDREDGTSVWDPDAAVAAMYPRLPPDTARAFALRLRPGASMPDAYPLDGPPNVPAVLVAARADEFFVTEWSRRVAAAVLDTKAIEIESGHFPMIEAPVELAEVLESCAVRVTLERHD